MKKLSVGIIKGSIVFFAMTIGLIGCGEDKSIKHISTERVELAGPLMTKAQKPLNVAVGAMLTPEEAYIYYEQFFAYLKDKLGMPIRIVDKKTYVEINELLEKGEIDLAFVCSQPYVDGKRKFGLELLLAPQLYGSTEYYSYIIAHAHSSIESLEDLRGKRFAFTDPGSNTGNLVPVYMLAKMGETPKSFFKEHVYSYAHDKSIRLVAEGIVDGAAVDSLIWDYQNIKKPKCTSNTKIILKSEPYGIPPLVVRPGLDRDFKNGIKKILKNMHNDEKGRKILNNMIFEKIVEIDDSKYDSIRQMQDFISKDEKSE